MALTDELFRDVKVMATVLTTLRCANPECNEPLLKVMICGTGTMIVPCCPKCHRGTGYKQTPDGIIVALIPKGNTAARVPNGAKRVIQGGKVD